MFIEIDEPVTFLYAVDVSDGVSTNVINIVKSFIDEDIKVKDFDNTRIGIVSYADDAQLILSPRNGITMGVVRSALRSIRPNQGKRDLKTALNYVLMNVIKNTFIVPESSKKIIVLFSGGKSLHWNDDHAKYYKEQFERTGTKVVLAITNSFQRNDLANLVLTQDNVLRMVNESNYSNLTNQITVQLIELTGMYISQIRPKNIFHLLLCFPGFYNCASGTVLLFRLTLVSNISFILHSLFLNFMI